MHVASSMAPMSLAGVVARRRCDLATCLMVHIRIFLMDVVVLIMLQCQHTCMVCCADSHFKFDRVSRCIVVIALPKHLLSIVGC